MPFVAKRYTYKVRDSISKLMWLWWFASCPPAETPVPDDFLCDALVDSKRYSVDPSNSAFNVTTSQYASKNPYSYRGSSCSLPGGLCRQMSSPGRFHDVNRNGEPVSCYLMQQQPLSESVMWVFHLCLCAHPAYSPDSGECKRPAGKDPSSWGVEEVVLFIKDADPQALGPHADAFRKHVSRSSLVLAINCYYRTKYMAVLVVGRENPWR